MATSELDRPDDAIAIAEGLHYSVVREGSGAVPPTHSRCLVHYVGRLADTGEVFMDTRKESQSQEPQVLVAGRDSAAQERGLHLAVGRMRCGERCRVWAAPEYGYGARGSFSFPTVPPNAHLVYDLELLDFDPPNEGKERATMTFEERLEAAERRRADGNAAFQAGQYDEALSKYRVALSYLNEDLLLQLGDFHFNKAMGVKRPVQLNVAACQLRQEDYAGAITTCSEVLAEEPKNAKALFRRGKARHGLGQHEAALEDLEAARAAAPGDAGIVRELAAVKAAMREEQRAADQGLKGFLHKASERLYEDEEPPAAAADEPPAAASAGSGGGEGLDQQRPTAKPAAPYSRSILLAAAAVGLLALLLPVLRQLFPQMTA